MHHYECVALCKDISLQRGRFCARSLASCIPTSSKDRSSWTFFIQDVCGRTSGRLQYSEGGSKIAWLRLAILLKSFRIARTSSSQVPSLEGGASVVAETWIVAGGTAAAVWWLEVGAVVELIETFINSARQEVRRGPQQTASHHTSTHRHRDTCRHTYTQTLRDTNRHTHTLTYTQVTVGRCSHRVDWDIYQLRSPGSQTWTAADC